ncbi:hypothetical protein E1295_18900 [Nonomuraea mesophila]|uniref:DUF4351 domain-containing protein n=1 Tax=Nonomuraea mesophila TaxID=2530382 RepID=A0A4R5FIF2_9ACTN|nr:hypothetical protein [Nonomuraea mesophila]TDE51182.1 hypothetical protein E1295_18900 [Nonomuraea mesophila]
MGAGSSAYEGDFAESLLAEGRAEGKAIGEAKMLQMLLKARGIEVSEEVRERITSCMDTAVLEEWFQRALTADCAEQVFE